MAKRTATLVAITLQYLSTALGIGWWWISTNYNRSLAILTDWSLVGMLSIILLIVALFVELRKPAHLESQRKREILSLLGIYVIVVFLVDPFLYISTSIISCLVMLLIVPPLVCMKTLINSRTWLALCAVFLFSASSVACLLFNATGRGFGIGFWWRWTE